MKVGTNKTRGPDPRGRDAMLRWCSAMRKTICVFMTLVLVLDLLPYGSLSFAAESILDKSAGQGAPTGIVGTDGGEKGHRGEPPKGSPHDDAGEDAVPERVRFVFCPGTDEDDRPKTSGHMTPYECVLDGKAHAIPSNEYAREGFTFVGWCTTSDGQDVADDEETENVDETMRALRLGDGQVLVDLGYDEETIHAEADSLGNLVNVTSLTPRNLRQVVRDGTVVLYAQWSPVPIEVDGSDPMREDAVATTHMDGPDTAVPVEEPLRAQADEDHDEVDADVPDGWDDTGRRGLMVRSVWSDGDNRDGMRPQEVQVHLYRNGVDTGLTQTLRDDEWTACFEDVPDLDEDGTEICYSVIEDAPLGYVAAVALDEGVYVITNAHQPEAILLEGEKTWSGGEDEVPQKLTVRLLADGRVVASRQVVPDADGRWRYSFGNYLRYRDGGVPIAYAVEEVADLSTWIPQQDGLNLCNVYHPFGDMRVEVETVGQTEAFSSKRFRFALEFVDAEGTPCANSFSYVASDGRDGTIGNGGVVEIASGESVTVKDIPHGTHYEIRQEEASGYEARVQDGCTGTIQGNRTAVAHVTNVYEASGSACLLARAILKGRTLQRHQFQSEIRDSEGTVLRTATNEEDGTFVFGAIGYTAADAGKTFEYLVVESDRMNAGYSYDDSTYTALVGVYDNGDGTLRETVQYLDARGEPCAMPLFENHYHARGEIELRAWKELVGRDCTPGEFTFELLDEQGVVIDTKPNDACAEIHFGPIPFDESDVAKPRYFAIREVKGDDADIVYDETVYAYAVTTADNGDGTLSLSQEVVDSRDMWLRDDEETTLNPEWEPKAVDALPVFHNKLKPGSLSIENRVDVASGHQDDAITFVVRLQGADTLTGEELSYTRQSISASNQGGNETSTVSVENGGFEVSLHPNESVVFEDCIPAGTIYSVYETPCDGWVLVSQRDSTGTIRARGTSHASFSNRFEESVTSVCLVGTVTLDGKAAVADSFEFMLCEKNVPMESVKTGEGGGIVFSPILYTREDVGIHEYSIVEVGGDDADIRYDEHEERVSVEVSEDGQNLVVRVDYDPDGISFSNVTCPGSLHIHKEVTGGGNPSQEFEFEVELKKTLASETDHASLEQEQAPGHESQGEGPLDALGASIAQGIGSLLEPRKAYADVPADTEVYWKIDDRGTLHLSNANVDGTFDGPTPVAPDAPASSSNLPWYSRREGIYAAVVDGALAPQKTTKWFFNCSNLTDISGLARLDMSKATDLNSMFSGCGKLEDISAVEGWNTSAVTKMGSAFRGCASLRDVSPLAGWDLRSITSGRQYRDSINYLFQNCDALTDIRVLANWNTSGIKHFIGVFSGCKSLMDITPLGDWNTSSALEFREMFQNCVSLQSIESLRNWDVSKATSLESMFCGCASLTSLSGLSPWKTERVQSFGSMFSECVGLDDLSAIAGWQMDTVTDLHSMFQGCVSLEDCRSLSSWRTVKANNLESMFQGCALLQNVDFASQWSVAVASKFAYMFADCVSLSDISGLASWNLKGARDLSSMFYNCPVLRDLAPIGGWDTKNVLNLSSLFYGCSSITDVSCLSGWNTAKVTSMQRIFDNCSALERADISKWSFASVQDAQCYPSFRNDLRLKRLEVSETTTLAKTNPISEHDAQDGYASTWMLEGTDIAGKTAREMASMIAGHQYTGTWVWEPDPQAAIVVFDPNGGRVNGETRVVQNGSVAPVAIPEVVRLGFELSGWNTSRDGEGTPYAAGATITPEMGKTTVLYAQWEDPATYVEYTVLHRLESAIDLGTFEQSGSERRRGSARHPVVVTPQEYAGFDSPDPQTVELAQDGSSVVVFDYARKRYTVVLDGNGIVEDSTQQFVQGVRQTLRSAPVIEGKTFLGWTKNKDGSGAFYADGQAVLFSAPTTLYAQYLDTPLSTEQQGTTTVVRIRVKAGETVSIPNIAAGTTYEVREVNVPKGWTEQEMIGSSGVVRANQVATVVAKNSYEASGSFEVEGTKSCRGIALAEGAFSFALSDEEGRVVAHATNDADGSFRFSGVSIDSAWVGQTKAYHVQEENTGEKYVRYDSHVEDISATFYDDGEGGLHANVRYDDDGCSFVNEFCLAMPSTGFPNSVSLESLLPIAALAVAPEVVTSYRRRRNERRATRNV